MGSQISLRTIFVPRLPCVLGLGYRDTSSLVQDRRTACLVGKDTLYCDDVQRTYDKSLALWAGIVSLFHSWMGVSHARLTLLCSIGGFYAFILGQSKNVELSVVARSNYEAVKTDVRA